MKRHLTVLRIEKKELKNRIQKELMTADTN